MPDARRVRYRDCENCSKCGRALTDVLIAIAHALDRGAPFVVAHALAADACARYLPAAQL